MRTTLAFIVFAACSRAPADSGNPIPQPSAPAPIYQDSSPMTKTSWRARTIAEHGLTIDLVDGIEPTEGQGSDQQFVVQRRAGAVAAVRIGSAMTLAWWRNNFGERKLQFGPETAVAVCGRAATRQEVTVPAETATGFVPSGGHMQRSTPAQVHVAISGTTNAGTPFVATWIVDVDKRDALRADEDHFFGAIRCD